MIKDPRVTVATIVEKEGRFLLVEEISDGKVVFNQPAGHAEEGEELIEAARRETLEETAWSVEITGFLGVYIMPMRTSESTYYRFCYAGQPRELTNTPLDKEIVAAHWLTYEQIVARKDQLRSPMVLRCIDDFRTRPLMPLDIVKTVANP